PRAEYENASWFSASVEERAQLTATDVVVAIEDVVRAIRRQLAESEQTRATFYVWHDEQAGQLRCSVSSRPGTDLPFAYSYELTDDLGVIVNAFLGDPSPGFVSWDQLEP